MRSSSVRERRQAPNKGTDMEKTIAIGTPIDQVMYQIHPNM